MPKVDPIEAVFLSLDPAKHTSGATILAPDYGAMDEEEHPFEGAYYAAEFGKVESQGERERFTQAWLDLAGELGLPPVCIAEEWDPPHDRKVRLPNGSFVVVKDPKWTYRTILGIGEGWGLWQAELHSADDFLREEAKLPGIVLERVTPNEWRDDFFEPPRPKDSEALKQTAQRYFEGIFGYRASADISEAGCIGLWGTTSERVEAAVQKWLESIPKKKSKNQRKTARQQRRAS